MSTSHLGSALRGCRVAAAAAAAASISVLACDGPQSTLDPAGREAQQILQLFNWMTIGAVLIWVAFVALTLYAGVFSRREHDMRTSRRMIVLGGVVFPTVLLLALLSYGLWLLPSLLAPAPPESLQLRVVGEQWWWRVQYPGSDGESIELANEIHLPVDTPVELVLEARDVIHSFWVPSLAGKMDMIPGHRTRLLLTPTRVGTFRGVCAEYCGASHAWMAFSVVVQERDQFDRWLARQASDARAPRDASARRGSELFLSNGCGACHAIRGTPADGTIGPDLTHFGSRLSIGAGLLPRDSEALARWIAHAGELKPSVHMPAFHMLERADLRALSHYLDGLR